MSKGYSGELRSAAHGWVGRASEKPREARARALTESAPRRKGRSRSEALGAAHDAHARTPRPPARATVGHPKTAGVYPEQLKASRSAANKWLENVGRTTLWSRVRKREAQTGRRGDRETTPDCEGERRELGWGH